MAVTAGAALFGAIIVWYGVFYPKHPVLGVAVGGLSGAIAGFVFAAVIAGGEIFLPLTRIGRALERAPILTAVAIKALAYSCIPVLVATTKFDRWLGTYLVFGRQTADGARAADAFPVVASMMVMLVTTAVVIVLIQVIGLIGSSTLRDVALGRYRRSHIEERFFLFVDIVGSTPLAEKLGPASVHEFLNRVFQLASDPIDDHAGEIYQYVGDEVVITWRLPEGRPGARPVACFFAIERALQEAAAEFEREFGAIPQLRAALHAGKVITGQVGGTRRAIVFHGDVLNTTSRIENATRELGKRFLASQDALACLEGLDAYAIADLGSRQLRGRSALVRLCSVEAKFSANAT